MESRKINLTASEWYQVTEDEKENFLLSVSGPTFFVLVKVSDEIPTDEDGSHVLGYMDAINHMILNGVVWAKGKQGSTSISLSKNWEEEDA